MEKIRKLLSTSARVLANTIDENRRRWGSMIASALRFCFWCQKSAHLFQADPVFKEEVSHCMHVRKLRSDTHLLHAVGFTLLRQQGIFHAFSCSSEQALTWTWVTKTVSVMTTYDLECLLCICMVLLGPVIGLCMMQLNFAIVNKQYADYRLH